MKPETLWIDKIQERFIVLAQKHTVSIPINVSTC